MQIVIGRATPQDAQAIAKLHAASFDPPWAAAAISDLLTSPNCAGFVARRSGDPTVRGFLLAQIVVDEAEVLFIGVDAGQRRQGFAIDLMGALIRFAGDRGAASIFLEVASDNEPALRLYRKLGFAQIGLRRNYYQRSGGDAADALCLKLALADRA